MNGQARLTFETRSVFQIQSVSQTTCAQVSDLDLSAIFSLFPSSFIKGNFKQECHRSSVFTFYFVTETKATTQRSRALKKVKEFVKESNREDIRWVREGNILILYNGGTKRLFHSRHANRFGFVHNKVISKVNGQYRKLNVRQPKLVKDYNAYYGRRRQY